MSTSNSIDLRLSNFPRGSQLEVVYEGRKLPAFAGETVAVALLAAGVQVLSRSIKFHRPRSVFCMTGDCGACLMRIGGEPNVRACQTLVQPGLSCQRQNAWPSASLDVLGAADLMFPEGMDHHALMTSPRLLNQVMQRVVQELGGLGRLPDHAPSLSELPVGQSRHVQVLVIGGGPAGLAAATAAAQALPLTDAAVLLVDAAPEPGGSYLSHAAYGRAAAEQAIAEARAAGVQILSQAAAIGYYPEETTDAAPPNSKGLLAVATPHGMFKLTADRYVYATGGHPQNALFIDNDLPGVMSGRAVGRLLTGHGILISERPLVVGDGDEAEALATALQAAGAQVTRIDGKQQHVAQAFGSPWVDGAQVQDQRGQQHHVRCDLIAVVSPPAAASQLAQLHGARVAFDPQHGFAVVTDAHGQTSATAVLACGEVTGCGSLAAAVLQGRAVGAAAAAGLSG